jgi:hypothetical protein
MWGIPHTTYAHQVSFVHVGQHDTTAISDVTRSQAFYGVLTDAPHLYVFTILEPTSFFAELLVPNISDAQNDKSGLLLRVHDGSVVEIARLEARGAVWDTFYEWFSGDSYRRGASYMGTLEPGTYEFEVSTPVNRGKYVLLVGKREEFTFDHYFQTVRDIASIKAFFGKSSATIIQTPFVYAPLLVFFGMLFLFRGFTQRLR